MLALPVGHLPDAHVGVVDGHGTVGHLLEAEAEQLARDPEHSLAQLLHLQVRLEVILVEALLWLGAGREGE